MSSLLGRLLKLSSVFIYSLIVQLTATSTQAGITYNAAADFSATSNPNGVWSYGQSATLTSTFQLYTNNSRDNVDEPPANLLDTWNGGAPGTFANPAVLHNGTSNTISFRGTINYLPGQLAFHPGAAGQFSIIRFTAPEAGQFALASTYSAVDSLATTDVHVLLNGVSLFNGNVNGNSTSFNSTLSIAAGDILDFKVGRGSNNTFFFDTTGVAITITAVPEPSSLMFLGLALSVLGMYRTLRSRKMQTVHKRSINLTHEC